MNDVFDRASELEQRQRDEALERVRQAVSSITVLLCHDCGAEIPATRRKAVPGCCRCVDCQANFEYQGRSRR